jgi:hypothetical protein
MLPLYNTPGHSKSHYGYPYFQDSPYYTEQHAYTPLVAQEYSSFEDMDTGYRSHFEDVTSSKQNSYKQLKPTPGASLPKKPGHQVRFSLSTNEKTKQNNDASPRTLTGTESPKAYKVCTCLINIFIQLGSGAFARKNLLHRVLTA